jgi:hypothetical protein
MAKLRYSLALMFLLFFLLNTAWVTLAALASTHGNIWSLVGDNTSMGLRILILLIVLAAVWGLDMLVHKVFLEAGISPVDTTAGDFAFMAYIILTAVVLLFLEASSWVVFAFLLALLFIFTVIILKRLLETSKQWLVWIVSSVVLAGLTVVLTVMLLGNAPTVA